MAWLGFYSLCREGSSSTTADEIVLIVDEMFLFALSRRVFVNSSAESLASPLRFLFALSRRVFVNGATVSTAGCVLVSIRFVAKGLRQLLVPAPEGVETTMFLFALSRRVFVNLQKSLLRLLTPVSIRFVAKGLRQPFFPGWAADQPCWCHYTHPTSGADLQVPGPCEIQASWLVCELHTRPRFAGFAHTPAGVTGSGGFAANHAAHWASTRTIPMPLPRKEPMPQ